jgi:hypothetical protein
VLAVLATAAVSMGPISGLVLSGEPYRWGMAGNAGLLGLVLLGGADLLQRASRSSAPDPHSVAEMPGPSVY